jgi:hypothetical protein
MMGLSWQQGPLGRDPNGTFLTGKTKWFDVTGGDGNTADPYHRVDIRRTSRHLVVIDGEKLEPAPGQNVIAHGPDRNLGVDEIGGIELAGDAGATET